MEQKNNLNLKEASQGAEENKLTGSNKMDSMGITDRKDHIKQASVEKVKKKKKPRFVIFAVCGILAVLLLTYLGVAMYFQTHFFPNTTVNGQDCSYQEKADLTNALEGKELKYRLDVEEKEGVLIGAVGGADIDMSIDIEEDVQKLLDGQNIYLWPAAFFSRHNYQMDYSAAFNEEKAQKLVEGFEALRSEGRISPEDAYISDYSPQRKGYEIIPEKEGTVLDMDKVMELVLNAIREGNNKIILEEHDCYVRAMVTAQDTKLIQKAEILNRLTGTRITYDWNGSEVILDGDTINQWIIQEDQMPVIDKEAVADFVASMAKENDTYGRKRKFTTTLGQELSLPSGGFGWKTNRSQETEELTELISQGAVTEREPVYSSRGAAKGSNDIDDSFVEIDLSNQHLYLYDKGNLILESDFVSGKMSQSGSVTPPGVFGLTYKTTNAVLRGEDYETPVNYWMPFNGNIGMHDATWRRSFGGDIFLTNGSHGCINLPLAKAKEIYGYLSTGYPVICYYY